MKHVLVLLLLGVCLHVTVAVHAQKISLSVKNAPLEKVFKEIHNQTGYNFLYASQLLAEAPKVTIEVMSASIVEVLDLIFKGMKLQYEINESTIVISAGKSLCVKDKIVELPGKNEGVNKEGHVAIKVVANRTIIYLKEEFELCKVKNNCLLFISSIALGKDRNPMQNKRIRKLEIIKELDEMVVFVYGTTSGQITVLRGHIAGVKIVLLTDQKRTSATVSVGSKYSSGVNLNPKAPAINRKL
jgi:hypothetical protein